MPTNPTKVALLIVAAGSGSRFGDPTPKQFLKIDGKSLVQHAIEAWQPTAEIDLQIHVAFQKGHEIWADKALDKTQKRAVFTHFFSSKTRQNSVFLGLKAMQIFAPHVVLIHDAARPFMPSTVFDETLNAVHEHGSAFASLPLIDAVHLLENGEAVNAVQRDQAVRAQTPQGFEYAELLAAHQEFEGQDFGDDVGLMQSAGIFPRSVSGSELGLKVTMQIDLAVLENR